MLLASVLRYYNGKKVNIAAALGVTTGYVSQWKEIIPEAMATKLAVITQGELEYDPDFYPRNKSMTFRLSKKSLNEGEESLVS